MTQLSHDEWTVMADRPATMTYGGWRWRAPWIDHETLMAMADRDDAIVMQRVVGIRRQVVARLAGDAWKRLQTRLTVEAELKL